jgi:carboxyl-terminal processing protease
VAGIGKVKQWRDDKIPRMRRSWKIVAVTLFCLSVVFGGLFGNRLLAVTDETRSLLRIYTDLVRTSHEVYGTEVSYKQLVQSSINGMLRTLDPHTSFLPREAYSNMRERQQESFHGLGILVGMRNGQLTVMTPIEGTPASRLGIRAGDVISTIEGESTEGMGLNEAVRQLKGPKGTQVRISITRPGLDELLDLTVTRDEIPQNTVRYAYMLSPETGYIQLSDFSRGTGQEMARSLEALKAQGMKSLVLDLRGNGGGLLDQAIAVADLFLPDGAKIVETRGRTGDSFQDYSASRSTPELALPLVVLVGQGSASAAEILAGAIQDHDMGLIVGTPTWGKGLVQTVYSLSYDSGLALTTAKYYTPSGRLIQRDYTSYFDYQTLANGHRGESVADVDPGQAFLTDLGREVYGGGGISPDIHIEQTTLSADIQYLLSRSAFFDFSVEYVQSHQIESRDWTPSAEILDDFAEWFSAHDDSNEREISEALEEPEIQEMVLQYLRAEIFNSVFGLEARYEVLAQSDVQILKALEVLQEASELLVRRQSLESEDVPEVTTPGIKG